jgi:hypothetical protein
LIDGCCLGRGSIGCAMLLRQMENAILDHCRYLQSTSASV